MAHEWTHRVVDLARPDLGRSKSLKALTVQESLCDVAARALTGSPLLGQYGNGKYLRSMADGSGIAGRGPVLVSEFLAAAESGHENVGIPNRAAHVAAERLGSDTTGRIWMRALRDNPTKRWNFPRLALETQRAAERLHGAEAAGQVEAGWREVGVTRAAEVRELILARSVRPALGAVGAAAAGAFLLDKA
jgi:Zn-dependent metalloprotease